MQENFDINNNSSNANNENVLLKKKREARANMYMAIWYFIFGGTWLRKPSWKYFKAIYYDCKQAFKDIDNMK